MRKIYKVLPDAKAAEHHYIRVIDESGEDYLYPEDYFILIELPKAVENSAAAGILIVSTISPNKEEFEQVVRIPGEEGNDHIFHDKKEPASIVRLKTPLVSPTLITQ